MLLIKLIKFVRQSCSFFMLLFCSLYITNKTTTVYQQSKKRFKTKRRAPLYWHFTSFLFFHSVISDVCRRTNRHTFSHFFALFRQYIRDNIVSKILCRISTINNTCIICSIKCQLMFSHDHMWWTWHFHMSKHFKIITVTLNSITYIFAIQNCMA